MTKVVDEKQGGYIELISNFLNEEKVDHTIGGSLEKPNAIRIARTQKAIEIFEKDCKISTNFYQGNEIGIGLNISKTVPKRESTLIRFGKSKNSKNLDIYTGISASEGPSGIQTTVGSVDIDITVKDAIKTPSEHSESFIIKCGCDYPFGIKCKGIFQR